MNQSFDVIVVGGGVVGLTAALGMQQKGYCVALLDAGSLTVDAEKTDRRVYAINQASKRLMQRLGVWANLDERRVSPYQQMHVWDAANGAAIDFDARLVATQNLGVIIEESILKQALLKTIQSVDAISLFPHQKVDKIAIEDRAANVSAGERDWQAALLIITDGANSPSRELLNVPLTHWSYQQHALVATVETERTHQQTAWQVFHADGPLAFLPLKDEHHCSIVWSTSPERVEELMAISDEDFNRALSTAFSERLGSARVISARHQFPLTMRHAKVYSGSCWLLAGDAAHSIHPLAGLGLNVGLADIDSWLELAPENSELPSFRRALSAYQRERKTEVWKIILVMESLKQCFGNRLLPIKTLRGLGLRCLNQLPLFKRLFIEQAMGR